MLRKSLGAIMALAAAAAIAQERTVPASPLPVPTDVSPQIQPLASRPISPDFDVVPQTIEEWVALQEAYNNSVAQAVPGQEQRLHVTAEESEMAGVTVYIVTPDRVADENRDRVLIHIHGGPYGLGGLLAASSWAGVMVGLRHYQGTSVAYRM